MIDTFMFLEFVMKQTCVIVCVSNCLRYILHTHTHHWMWKMERKQNPLWKPKQIISTIKRETKELDWSINKIEDDDY